MEARRDDMSGDMVFDGRGLSCAWCHLKIRGLLKSLAPGQILEALTADPRSSEELPRLLLSGGGELVEARREGDHWRFFLRRT